MEIDIRKIYLCQITKISDIYDKKTDEDDVVYLNGRPIVVGKKSKSFYVIDSNDTFYGLFVKGLTGYKHILTGTKYRLASNSFVNVGEYVINPDNIELFVKKERQWASRLISKNKSFGIDVSSIKEIEDEINKQPFNSESNEII